MQIINTDAAATPGGHYSQAIASNGLLFISGLLPVSADGTHNNQKSFEEQVKVVLTNLDAILKAGNSDKSNLIKVTVYITDLGQWGVFNSLYAAFLGDHKPARAVVPVPELHHGYLVEVEATAKVNA